MPTRPLWRISDPADLARQAAAREEVRQAEEKQRAEKAAERKAQRQREAALLAQQETRRRAEERQKWLAEHTPPTKQELAALLDELVEKGVVSTHLKERVGR